MSITVQLQEGTYFYDEVANDFVWHGADVGDPVVVVDGTAELSLPDTRSRFLRAIITPHGQPIGPIMVALKPRA